MKTPGWWLGAALVVAPALASDLFEHPQTPAQTQATLSAAMPGLGQVQLLRGRFNQRKFLREIPRPLFSTGEFLLVRDLGIWWHVRTPLDSELTLIAGSRARPDPASSMFLALLALDLDTLARSFDFFVQETATPAAPNSHWLLGLRPRDAAVAAWFKQATIGGSQEVEQVTLLEAAGDRTEIELHSTVQPRSSLTPAERQHFDP